MKALLIKPPWSSLTTGTANLPLGLLYVAAAASEVCPDVAVLNADYWEGRRPGAEYVHLEADAGQMNSDAPFELIRETLEQQRPDVVGLSLMTAEYVNARRVMELVRVVCPGAITVLGGAHVTLRPQQTLLDLGADYAMAGEGEAGIAALLKALKSESRVPDIPGLYRRGQEPGQVLAPSFPAARLRGEDIPMPLHKALLNPQNQEIHRGLVSTARGCPGKCSYCATCALWPGQVIFRPVPAILREVREIYADYNVRQVRFVDDTFTAERGRVLELCRELESLPGLSWSADTQAVRLDREVLEAMLKAGCCQINIGVESGSDPIRRQIRKPGTLAQAEAAVRLAHEVGLAVVAYFMIGFPGETREDMERTFAVMRSLPAYPICSLATPYPGTSMHTLAQQRIPQENLEDFARLFHHCATPMNMTSLPDEEWRQVQSAAQDEVRALTAAYGMAERQVRAKELGRAMRERP